MVVCCSFSSRGSAFSLTTGSAYRCTACNTNVSAAVHMLKCQCLIKLPAPATPGLTVSNDMFGLAFGTVTGASSASSCCNTVLLAPDSNMFGLLNKIFNIRKDKQGA